MPILIQPEAVKRFNEVGDELVGEVVPVNVSNVRAEKYDLHPVAKFTGQNVIGKIEFTDHIIDSNGTLVGRAWTFDGRIHGLVRSGFEKCNRLSGHLAALKEIRDFVSFEFIAERVFEWVAKKFVVKQAETLIAYLAARCEQEIQEYETSVSQA